MLPFQNLSADPEQEYFSDGIVEEITTALSRFGSLLAISRNSALPLRAAPSMSARSGASSASAICWKGADARQRLQKLDPKLRSSTLEDELGPYHRPQDIVGYVRGIAGGRIAPLTKNR